MRYLLYALVPALLLAASWLGWQFIGNPAGESVASSAPAGKDMAGMAGAPRGDDMTGYAKVTGPRPMRFPQDHGAHPDYRIEWWYFTGNLATPQKRPFGFELTFFRFAMAPSSKPRASDWATRQMWSAHFAISDIAARHFHVFQRSERGAAGLAGARIDPVRVWIDNWEVRAQSQDRLFPALLHAEQDGVRLDLQLTNTKPLVLEGDEGYSQKSTDPDNASYYYSYTRLLAQGRLSVGGGTYPVSGSAWMDREWSSSVLARNQAGWDWLSLQLDDGRDLMLYRLRRRDGSTDPNSAGVLVAQDGKPHHLSAAQFKLTPLRDWRSEATGVSYPVAWRVQVPLADLDFEVQPRMPNQELNLRVRYWEGAVSVTGAKGDKVSGHGYLELTGYGPGGEARSDAQAGG